VKEKTSLVFATKREELIIGRHVYLFYIVI